MKRFSFIEGPSGRLWLVEDGFQAQFSDWTIECMDNPEEWPDEPEYCLEIEDFQNFTFTDPREE